MEDFLYKLFAYIDDTDEKRQIVSDYVLWLDLRDDSNIIDYTIPAEEEYLPHTDIHTDFTNDDESIAA
ncbi:MAG: hypothetical protein H6620_11605 [Halobacteriovoraceae bacterium]|nr:hypothetical protein [Halobacteriovoraceae bacterium]